MKLEELSVIVDGCARERADIELAHFGVYEVMRLNYRGPLFFDEHLARLNNSLKLAGINHHIEREVIKSDIYKLVEVHGNLDANITLYITELDGELHRHLYYTKTLVTPEEAYRDGLSLKTYNFERKNPKSKEFTREMQQLRAKLKEDDCYDYVLVDEEGKIREASRSNLFFFKAGKIYTASDEAVLPGITREKVLGIIKEKFELIYDELPADELGDMDGAFLSGTSPGIVPIAKIDDITYDVSHYDLVRELMRDYARLIDEYYDGEGFFEDMRQPLFSRQLALFGAAGDGRLSRSKIMVIGLGGVGASACEAIARCGVGEIILVDFDAVEPSNINRQLFATYRDIGRLKTEAAEARLRSINPALRVTLKNLRLTEDNISELEAYSPDYIVDAIDSFGAKIALIKWAKTKGTPIVSSCGMASKMEPLKLKFGDIYSTSVCPLAKKMRQALRSEGVNSLSVVYSTEEAAILKTDDGSLASLSFVPNQAGLILASKVVRDIVFGVDREVSCQNMK